MVGPPPRLEFNIVRVEDSYRIRLPQAALRVADWIVGENPISAWLLVPGPGKCRLLSAADVSIDPDLQRLKTRITAEAGARAVAPMEFRDEPSLALAARLVEIQLTPPEPGWRLTLPRPLAAVMSVRPKESELAAVLLQKYIEFWTIETLRSAVAIPLPEIL